MMYVRSLILSVLLLFAVGSYAITQRGVVRTAARKDQPSERLEGAIIRVTGSHNAVLSREQGDFELLLAGHKNGEPYSIARITLRGYELADQGLIGRLLPCSEQVTQEVVLVNSATLRQEREEIEQRILVQVESDYNTRLQEIERQRDAALLSEEEAQKHIRSLENRYEHYEALLHTISDQYARTDYAALDVITTQINRAIEDGNIDEAERLIRKKGNLTERAQRIHEEEKQQAEAQSMLDEQNRLLDERRQKTMCDKRQLSQDYYSYYTIHFSRFRIDSAALYIQLRANLDTTNVDYQLQAGEYMKEVMNDLPHAMQYYQRAYRIAEREYSEMSGQMATICHEIGSTMKNMHRYDEALVWYNRALDIKQKLKGNDSPAAAETLNNIGVLYQTIGNDKRAMQYHQQALKIRNKKFGKHNIQTAVSQANIAAIYAKQKSYHKAETMLQSAIRSFELYLNGLAKDDRQLPITVQQRLATAYKTYGYILFNKNEKGAALEYLNKAYNLYLQVLSPFHPNVISTKADIDTIESMR